MPRQFRIHWCLVALLGSTWNHSLVSAEDRFEPLLRQAPAGANAVMVIDMEAVKESKIAQDNNWANAHQQAYTERPLVLPAQTALAVIAAKLDVKNQLKQVWEMALLELTDPLPLSAIAKAEGGRMDQVEEVNVVWSPSGAYFLDLGPERMALTAPDDRQFVARWLNDQKDSQEAEVSPYLIEAIKDVSAPHPIVLALDLAYAIQPHRLRTVLEQSQALRDDQDQVETFIPLIAGMQGVKLQVSLNDSASGTLTIDFATNVEPLRKFAKPLVLETLDRFDAHLPGLEKWSVHVSPNQIVMKGRLTPEALRRVFSLLELPTTRFSNSSSEEQDAADTAAAAARKSQAYFRSVSKLIEDLNSSLRQSRDNHAVWMERYAKKIDQLPLLGVDSALLDWGASVAETMRTMALAERGAGIRSGARKSAVYGDYFSYNENGYGGNAASQEQMLSQITAQERAQAKAVRYTSWNDMLDATSKVRREMTQKYQVEF